MECVRVCVYMTERKKAKFSDFPYNRCGNIHWRTQPAQLSSSANTQVLPIFPLGKNSQLFIPGPCRKKAWLTAVSHSHLLWPKSLKSSTTLAFPAYLPYHPLAMLSFLLSNTSRTLLDPSIARQRNCINLVVVLIPRIAKGTQKKHVKICNNLKSNNKVCSRFDLALNIEPTALKSTSQAFP